MNNLESKNLQAIINDLSKKIDFKKELPLNLFLSENLNFWFFERPLINHIELISQLASESRKQLNSNLHVKFSGDLLIPNSCVVFSGKNYYQDAQELSKHYINFLDGAVGYPIVFFNEELDWIGFESAFEELGVIAVNRSQSTHGFSNYLDSNFISSEKLIEWSIQKSIESKIAKVFLHHYAS